MENSIQNNRRDNVALGDISPFDIRLVGVFPVALMR
jgi:hypothetical protein